MRSKQVLLGATVILALVFVLSIFQQCEKGDDESIVSAEFSSSCESCHTDNAALESLAEPDETVDSEEAGEG